MKEYSIFDIIGPSMVGPSSSHTAGACKLGKVASKIAEKNIKEVKFLLHGSFAKTYIGHGTDKALLAGVLGFDTDDERIKQAFEIAKIKGVKYCYKEADLGDVHENTVKIIIKKANDETVDLLGSSIGGGSIVVTQINGLELEFTGEYTTLIISHQDRPGVISKVSTILSDFHVNIAFMRVYRYGKRKNAFMIIETDDGIEASIMKNIKDVEGISKAYLVTI
ncbi:L-serine ammonia-lyase, iron-sulfur-dependent subunit beta [Serpentinicella sp. ANB-PHB4]|uniref:L-serine ammonia-lyase, iron-sulfur-dependent subunit beta n=1 Tax=Serpentinicella sp. ANB-PHB4 TaxID=3074076 RepID=UPI0028617814|nr:L-serine ammonia-lyase, iron-sulfur-dependent subunit beta [Serpentinicella sp. ANB-PHB4]MDR5658049.1 L-serine ammonia-lyase, iron-sulfur-dependent subunit beta [Serpentinicella sp. ANB-PHB4]